jgi:hypothetical protein
MLHGFLDQQAACQMEEIAKEKSYSEKLVNFHASTAQLRPDLPRLIKLERVKVTYYGVLC